MEEKIRFIDRHHVVETKNCFFELSFYPRKIPEICRWMIQKVYMLSKQNIKQCKKNKMNGIFHPRMEGSFSIHCFPFIVASKQPETSRNAKKTFLSFQDEFGQYQLKMIKLNDTERRRAENNLICCVESLVTGHSPPNITLTIILTTIFLILLVIAIITWVRRRKETAQVRAIVGYVNVKVAECCQ